MTLKNPKTTLAGYAILAFLLFYEVTGFLKTGTLPIDVGALIALVSGLGLIASQDGKHVWVLGLIFLAGGCATGAYRSMTPEQIREAVKDKSATVNCVVLNTPYGRGVDVFMSIDRSVIANGSVKVSDQCQTEFSSEPVKK